MANDDGIEFILNVREEFPEIKCTLLTGFARSIPANRRYELNKNKIRVISKSKLVEEGTNLFFKILDVYDGALPYESLGEHSSQTVLDSPEASAAVVSWNSPIGSAETLDQNELISQIEERDILIRNLAYDLAEDLSKVARSSRSESFWGPLGRMSVDQLVSEIQAMSPLGMKMIELDRSAKKRIRRLQQLPFWKKIYFYFFRYGS